jgi:hypothetical protein
MNSYPHFEGSRARGQHLNTLAQGDVWIAIITKDHKVHYLGTFLMEEEAAQAYNRRAKELYDRPMLNPVEETPVPEPSILPGPGRGKRLKTKSRYLGVTHRKNRWTARVKQWAKRLFLGYFKEEADAARIQRCCPEVQAVCTP